jgi:hypothetical protein
MRERFKNWQPKGSSKVMIAHANAILTELMDQGYTLTLRQLYYQLVARGTILNRQTEYKRLGSIINDARLAGLIDWDAIEDRTRNLQSVPHWKEPSDIIRSAAESFRLDKWVDQKYRIECWVEKDALVGVLERACRELDVAWFSCRGYTSQSELYGAGKRLSRYICQRQTPIIIHLGDHDPSGKDMTRDIEERLCMFVGFPVKVERIALNMDQIHEYNPPPNPAKVTDSRFEEYERQYGDESWELDALNPRVIDDLIREKVAEYRDDDLFTQQQEEERIRRKALSDASGNWQEVAAFLTKFEKEKVEAVKKARRNRQ